MRSFRILTLVVCIPLLVLTSFAQQPSQPQPSAPPQQPATAAAAPTTPIAEQIRKTVGFLTVGYGNSQADIKGGVIGTCFFVAVADQRLGEGQAFIYLVTNRHVAQPGIDLGTPYQVQAVMLRMNLVTPVGGLQSTQELIPLDRVHWFFPSDDAVDLAIANLAPDQKKVDYMSIPSTLIVTSEQLKNGDIGVNDPVTFAGYFANFPGHIRMEPIVREGVIAMLPEEKFDTTLHKQGRLFLADLHAFHGNSGSPVFVNIGGFHHGAIYSGERYFLLGVLSGYYPESAGFSVPAATILTGEVRDNSGIATIVPGEELTNLLNSPELQADRDRQVKVINPKAVSQK
jgi:hypothetical protein